MVGVPARTVGRHVRGILPAVLLMVAVQHHAFSHARSGIGIWQYLAAVHIVALGVSLVIAGIGAARRHQDAPATAFDRASVVRLLAAGSLSIALPAVLLLWSQGKLSNAATGIAAFAAVAALSTRRRSRATRRITVAGGIVSLGSMLVIFGRNTGLGLAPLPFVYLPLVRGAGHPDGRTLVSLLALVAGGFLTARLWRQAERLGFAADPRPYTTTLLLAPGAAVLLLATILKETTPAFSYWAVVGGTAFYAYTSLATRLAAAVHPVAAAVTTLAGVLPASVSTSLRYDVHMTTVMLIGGALIVAGMLLLRSGIAGGHETTSGTVRS